MVFYVTIKNAIDINEWLLHTTIEINTRSKNQAYSQHTKRWTNHSRGCKQEADHGPITLSTPLLGVAVFLASWLAAPPACKEPQVNGARGNYRGNNAL